MSASYEGLIQTVPGVNLEVLRMDNYQIDKSKDTLFRGEFEVVKELVAALGDQEDVKELFNSVIKFQFVFGKHYKNIGWKNFFFKT